MLGQTWWIGVGDIDFQLELLKVSKWIVFISFKRETFDLILNISLV